MSTYEKQLRWKKTVMNLAKATHLREEEEKDDSLSFTPQYCSAPLQEFEGSARQSTDKSAQMHIARQSKARKEKKEQMDRLTWTEKTRPSLSGGKQSSNWISSASNDNDGTANFDNTFTSNISKSGNRSRLYSDHQEEHEKRNTTRYEECDGDDIPVVELLEKERKDWQLERLKLIHCIHLQQIELSQRSIAAHDRATDIAKEFARAIEGFEERLIAVETNVQKEIMAIKILAESIMTAVSSNSSLR